MNSSLLEVRKRTHSVGFNDNEELPSLESIKEKYFRGLEFEPQDDVALSQEGRSVERIIDGDSEEDWRRILEAVLDEIVTVRAKGKRRKKFSYDEFIREVLGRASKFGFSDEELKVIWKAASIPSTALTCTQRRILLLNMVPKSGFCVGSSILDYILCWLPTAHANGIKPTVLIAVYQLLNLYVEYSLAEEGAISNYNAISCILQTPTENLAIPWKMNLFRNLITPVILEKPHIFHLKNLLMTKDAKKTHIDDINASIGLCRHIKPELFEGEDPEASFGGKLRFLEYPNGVRNLFFNCKQQLSSQALELPHPYADRIFPEFLPVLRCSGPFVRMSGLDIMLKLLSTDDGIMELAFCPPMLQMFTQWMQLMVYHRFHSFSGICSVADARRYGFLFDRCLKIMKVRQEGLDTDHIFSMLQFVSPHNVLPYGSLVSGILVDKFSHHPRTRLRIWETLNTIKDFWLEHGLSDSVYLEGFSWLLDCMDECVTELVINPEFGDDHMLVFKICMTYKDLHYKSGTVTDSSVKAKMEVFPPVLMACVVLLQDMQCLEIMCGVMTRRSHQYTAAISHFTSQNLVSSSAGINLPRELILVAEEDFRNFSANSEGLKDMRKPKLGAISPTEHLP